MRRFAAILLLLGVGASLPAASTDYYLGESVRQLGLRDAPRQAGDGRSSERYVSRAGISLYADYSKEFILVDGVKVMLDDPIGSQRGHLTLSRRDYDKVFVPLFWELPKVPVRRIVLDPGHGGKDTGKINGPYKYTEKAATLDTAARLKILLEKQGFEVVFTRTKDVFVDLDDRPALAANAKADLFVSLHYNAGPAGDSSSDGIETYSSHCGARRHAGSCALCGPRALCRLAAGAGEPAHPRPRWWLDHPLCPQRRTVERRGGSRRSGRLHRPSGGYRWRGALGVVFRNPSGKRPGQQAGEPVRVPALACLGATAFAGCQLRHTAAKTVDRAVEPVTDAARVFP